MGENTIYQVLFKYNTATAGEDSLSRDHQGLKV